MVKLISVVGIRDPGPDKAHHIEIVILHSDLQKTVPLTIIGLKALGMSYLHTREQNQNPQARQQTQAIVRSQPEAEYPHKCNTLFVEGPVATANICETAPSRGDWP